MKNGDDLEVMTLEHGVVTEVEGLHDSEGHVVVISATHGGGLHIERSNPDDTVPEPEESADENAVMEALTALLGSSEPAEKDENDVVSEDDLDNLAKVFAKGLSGEVREAVNERLTALTGRLD